ncbi:MAG: CPBP family intramembrane metalloprotease [Nitrospirae bacterium]|nr:MAG: CPBP family intramembrane metalloprotease [Nitrospirota bacterium]
MSRSFQIPNLMCYPRPMSDLPSEALQEVPPVPSRPAPLSPWVTAVCGAVAGAYLGFSVLTVSPSPLDRLDQPEESLERLVTREMDLRAALRQAPEWKKTLYATLSGGEDTLADVIAWYDELIGTGASPIAQLYRVVLVAEDGQTGRLNAALVPWEFQGEAAFRMGKWVRAGYLGSDLDREGARSLLMEIRSELPPGWFADTLAARVAAKLGDPTVQREAEAAIGARGAALLDRWIGLTVAQGVLLVLGIVALGGILRRRTAGAVGEAPLPPVWTAQDGYGLFVRGTLGFLLIGLVSTFLLPKESPYSGISTLAAGLPLVWWLHRYLSVRGLSLPETFGLTLPAGGLRRVAAATFVVIGLSVLGEVAITLVSGTLNYKPHWADGLLESILWGPPWLVACEVLDSVVWAPLIEELAFRGVLYATLRMTVGVWPAVGLSGAFFALVHGYGAVGFASVLWSGILWAVAYERTRSLLPAILGHMFNNLLVTTEFIWLLRL